MHSQRKIGGGLFNAAEKYQQNRTDNACYRTEYPLLADHNRRDTRKCDRRRNAGN